MPDLEAQDVIGYVDQITNESAFTKRNAEWQRHRSILFQENQVSLGEGAPSSVVYRGADIEQGGNDYKNRFLAAPIKINVGAISESERARIAAQRQENFYYRYIYRWRDEGRFDGPLFDQATLGEGWTHLRLNSEALPLVPDFDGSAGEYTDKAQKAIEAFVRDGSGDLFVLEDLDPLSVFAPPAGGFVVSKLEMPLHRLQKQYEKKGKGIYRDERKNYQIGDLAAGEHPDYKTANWADTATLYTLETDEYCYHVLFDIGYVRGKSEGGHILGAYQNYWGRPGFSRIAGEKTGSRDPLLMYRSPLQGKYQILPNLELLVTGMVRSGIESAQQRMQLVWEGEGPEPDDMSQTVEVTPDGVIHPPPGYKLEGVNLPVGQDNAAAINLLRDLDTFGLSKGITRPEEFTATSGYDRARALDSVASQIAPLLSHFGTSIADLCKMMAHAGKMIDLPLTVRTMHTRDGTKSVGELVTVQPSDWVETDINVDFNSVSLFNAISLQEEGIKMMQADVMHLTEYLSKIRGVDDVEAWRKQWLRDKGHKMAAEEALIDLRATLGALRGVVAEEAVNAAAVDPIVTGNEDQIRSDRGASIPTDTGHAIPVTPTPPGMGEMA